LLTITIAGATRFQAVKNKVTTALPNGMARKAWVHFLKNLSA
jgi:hypothetical protein